MRNKLLNSDYALAIVFGLATLIVFALELYYVTSNNQPTLIEKGLFGVLEFGLAIGFGWALQRIDSQKRFQESLKSYALSAHRRIRDIEKSIYRLINTIEILRSRSSQSYFNEFDALRLIADGMIDTTKSSVADWVDVIGEELSTRDRLEELTKERLSISSKPITINGDSESSKKFKALSDEIQDLKSKLPYLLQTDVDDYYPRDGRFSDFVYQHYQAEIDVYSRISIIASPFTGVGKERIDPIQAKKPYSIEVEQNMFTLYPGLYDKDRNLFALVENPFDDTLVYGNDYVVTLITILAVITGISDSLSISHQTFPPIILENAEVEITSMKEREMLIIKIPVSKTKLAFG